MKPTTLARTHTHSHTHTSTHNQHWESRYGTSCSRSRGSSGDERVQRWLYRPLICCSLWHQQSPAPKAQENRGGKLKTYNLPQPHILPPFLSGLLLEVYVCNRAVTMNISRMNSACNIISAPPDPSCFPFSPTWMAWMLHCTYRGSIGSWYELNSSALVSCCAPSCSGARLILSDSPVLSQRPYSCRCSAVSKSFFILPRRLVTQDLSNKITTVYFSLCGTMERGSELSCNV